MGKLLLLFVALPAIELAILIELGSRFGTLHTIGLIVVTGVVGASLARGQGISVVRAIQSKVAEGRLPAVGGLGASTDGTSAPYGPLCGHCGYCSICRRPEQRERPLTGPAPPHIAELCLGCPAWVHAFQGLHLSFEVGARLYGEDLVGDVTNDLTGLVQMDGLGPDQPVDRAEDPYRLSYD